MRQRYEDLYHDRTWFDELGERVMQPILSLMPRNQAQFWTLGFTLIAGACIAWSAGLAAHTVVFELPPNKALAQWLAAAMLLVAARHFMSVIGQTATSALPRHTLIRRSSAVRRVSAAPIQQRAEVKTPAAEIAPSTPVTPSPAPVSTAAATPAPAENPQEFFRAVKAAGINVGIARSLYAAGFRSADQVRASDDASLLAAPGVGRATLRKLRVKFGLPKA